MGVERDKKTGDLTHVYGDQEKRMSRKEQQAQAREARKSRELQIFQTSLRSDLLAVFARYSVTVAVGVTDKGIAIRSQDERVDASNIGTVNKQS